MGKYLIKRILIAIPVLLMVTVFCFGLVNMAPGDPSDLYLSQNATQVQKQEMRRSLGLNQPVYIQYIKWLTRTLKGNLGISFATRAPVTEVIFSKLGATVELLICTLILSYVIAIPLGIICARHQGGWLDNTIMGVSFLGISIPSFFFGLAMVYIFAVQLNWLPTGGMTTLGQSSDFIDRLRHIIMPTVVLSLFYCSNMMRYVRSSMVDIFSENYIRTAISKGLSKQKVLWRHGFRNALIPIITVISSDIPKMLGGAVVTEQIFSWPGIGQLTVSSIGSRDYPMLMAINLIAAVGVLICNLIADILYAVVDPRIRY